MTVIENPFEHRRPVAPSEAIGRTEEAARLEALAHEANNARLIAPPGYGKTSLLRRVQARLGRAGWATVHVPLLDVTTMGALAGRVAGALARTLGPSTRDRFPDLSQELARETERLSPRADAVSKAVRLRFLLSQVRQFSLSSGRQVHVAFDDFDELNALERGWDGLLRSEIQHHGREVTYVFSGARKEVMYYLFADPRAAFYTQAVPVRLGTLEAQPLGTYIAERFASTGKAVLPAAVDALIELCQGHPRRAMAAAHALWDTTDDEAGPPQWAVARAKLMGDASGELRSLWRVFASDERRVLAAVATGGCPPVGRGGRISGSALPAAHSSLHDKAVIAGSNNRWRIVDPLLAEWIRGGHRERLADPSGSHIA